MFEAILEVVTRYIAPPQCRRISSIDENCSISLYGRVIANGNHSARENAILLR